MSKKDMRSLRGAKRRSNLARLLRSLQSLAMTFLLMNMSIPFLFAAEGVRHTAVVDVVRNWSPSVVNISTEKIVLLRRQPFWGDYGDAFDSFFKEFYGPAQQFRAVRLRSIGSGVILHPEVLTVTNAHVINMASTVFAVFQNGKTVGGRGVLINQRDDLAFVKIDPPFPLKPVTLADQNDIMTGETVVAIGNPYGLGNSVSVGVVSGTSRFFALPSSRHVFTDLIQTDASINVGSSGGALLNLDGQLVGINLAIIQNAQNIAFAVSPGKIKEGLNFYETKVKNVLQNQPKSRKKK